VFSYLQSFDYDLIEHFTVLHPRHKLHYFKTAGWENTWIETARTIVREEFDRTYAFMDVESETKKVRRHRIYHLNLLTPVSSRRLQYLRIYLMICPRYRPLCLRSSETSLTVTSVVIQN
jgi:DNA-dependent RNA polymerase auxiliary subunit epsilon